MNYWLMKSEPNCYSIDDLKQDKIEHWDGVRNYQARNMLRDQMKKGDLAFFYHSNCKEIGIVGIMKIVKEGYPDVTARDPENDHYDPKSTENNPRWFMVDVGFVEKLKKVITLNSLKQQPVLAEMPLLQKGNRLSVMPVSKTHWHYIINLREH
ncbi:MAG: EVE domain-containing protein [Gammaproteobacteria bacterium RIFCSPHIGHO2_12_FULL_41_15]|nr:MAG: EVE domain-containing protein [Gammaproteobacteria bacterium RIFCSPHIGHO2_12_FULL_41_15]